MLPAQKQKEDDTDYQELCKLEQERSMRLVKQNWVLQSELQQTRKKLSEQMTLSMRTPQMRKNPLGASIKLKQD